jgi:hypothetical protein
MKSDSVHVAGRNYQTIKFLAEACLDAGGVETDADSMPEANAVFKEYIGALLTLHGCLHIAKTWNRYSLLETQRGIKIIDLVRWFARIEADAPERLEVNKAELLRVREEVGVQRDARWLYAFQENGGGLYVDSEGCVVDLPGQCVIRKGNFITMKRLPIVDAFMLSTTALIR